MSLSCVSSSTLSAETMPEISIRPGRPADLGAIEALTGRIENFAPEEAEVAIQVTADGLCQGAEQGYRVVCAEGDNGSLVGYACFGAVPMTEGTYDLYWLAVDPSARKHGVGRKLLAAVEEELRSQRGRRLFIETSGRENYLQARRLYESFGCDLAARLTDYYRPGDDKYIYVKVLEGSAA